MLPFAAHTENLQAHFCSEQWTNTHNKGKNKINQVVVYHIDAIEIERPAVEPKFSTLSGGKSTYAYLMQRQGFVGTRPYGGWCEACQRGLGPNNGLSSRLHVLGCSCADKDQSWAELTIERTDAAGVANRRKAAQARGKTLASKLKEGSWIAVQARERWSTSEETHLRAGHFWLARVVAAGHRAPTGTSPFGAVHKVPRCSCTLPSLALLSCNSLFSCCRMLQVTQRRLDINGTVFTEGDFAIAVRWYDRLADDSDGLKFRQWRPPDSASDDGISMVNSTELRAADVDVRPIVQSGLLQPSRVQPVRTVRGGRRAALVELAPPREPPADTVFEILADVDSLIRRECW